MIVKYLFKRKEYFLIKGNYIDKAGKRSQPSFRYDKKGERITSFEKAKKLEKEYLNHFKFKNNIDRSHVTFRVFWGNFLRQCFLSLKYSTAINYKQNIESWVPQYFFDKKLEQITQEDAYQLIFKYIPGHGATLGTRERVLIQIKKIMDAAVEEGLINANPFYGMKVPTPPLSRSVLDSQEASLLLHHARKASHKYYYLWALALLTGMRNGELYCLRWSNIDMITKTILVNSSWSYRNGHGLTKNNRNRTVPISEELHTILLELKDLGPFQETLQGLNGSSHYIEDLVLPRMNEWRYGDQSLATRRFCQLIGITPVKFHDLRATFITNLLSQGVSLGKVMPIAGHKQASTTDGYLRFAGVDIQGETDRLSY